VRRDMAMTGEVTLRGKALEIGGLKEKVLAAYRAGLREVIVPQGNAKDLRDIPAEVRERMTFTFVQTMDEVLDRAMLPLEPSERRTPESVERIEESSQVVLPFPDRTSAIARSGP
jgi:ATP-dependent Lon protease